jgi:diguanylate cyclase (GGDEF)-like protein
MGIFQAVSKKTGFFDEIDVELTEILLEHVREELKRIRLEEKLRKQATRDPLTDVYNRRYFNESLSKEVEESRRYDRPIAFLMLDLNRFKEINDTYSHHVGDKVLKKAADLIKENVRGADTVVRYGGDEFLVMMPETNGGVVNTKKHLEEKFADWSKKSDLLNFPLTFSAGSSHWHPDQKRDVEDALKEADIKMYKDKKDKFS